MPKATHSTPMLLILALLAAACSSGPPPSCGAEIGGTADTATFDQYFNSMALVSQTTGQPGEDSDEGAKFAQDEPIQILADVKTEVAVRACIQPLSGQGEIADDRTDTIGQGERTLDFGPFSPGSYVIRVIVDNTLVKNFPFQIE
jgi:hypothetical protein